jgi:TetR/AcrR family transcriptional regulator, transcriptional repressor for nem operon
MSRTRNSTYPELIQKAQHLFWVKGFKAVTPEDLAKHLNVSVSTIYNKYTKDLLFIDALDNYVVALSDPIIDEVRNSTKGLDSFKDFFYMLIDWLLDKSFTKSCLMVNTVVELRHEQGRVSAVYERYFGNMKDCYRVVLKRAAEMKELKHPERIEEYTEFMLGVIFGLSILYKIKSREELREYIDEQISLIES